MYRDYRVSLLFAPFLLFLRFNLSSKSTRAVNDQAGGGGVWAKCLGAAAPGGAALRQAGGGRRSDNRRGNLKHKRWRWKASRSDLIGY